MYIHTYISTQTLLYTWWRGAHQLRRDLTDAYTRRFCYLLGIHPHKGRVCDNQRAEWPKHERPQQLPVRVKLLHVFIRACLCGVWGCVSVCVCACVCVMLTTTHTRQKLCSLHCIVMNKGWDMLPGVYCSYFAWAQRRADPRSGHLLRHPVSQDNPNSAQEACQPLDQKPHLLATQCLRNKPTGVQLNVCGVAQGARNQM